MLRALISLCVVVCLSLTLPQLSTLQADTVYTGSITTEPGSSQGKLVTKVPDPADPTDPPDWSDATLTWTVTGKTGEDSIVMWTYLYSFTGFTPGDVSHFIIEVSEGVTLGQPQFFGVDEGYKIFEPASYSGENPSNPNMPGSVFGVKFEGVPEGGEFSVEFMSSRIPVWGDFYAKSGAENNLKTAWNAGFSDPDPLDAADNGSLFDHILRPDTVVNEVPEPGTLIGLLSMGIVGAFACRLRRRKQ